jgi:serine/threonine protein kinase
LHKVTEVSPRSFPVPLVDSSSLHQMIRREANVWIQLSHDHILPFEGITMSDDFGPLPALVSQWMEHGSLNEYLKQEFPQLSDGRKIELVGV